MPTIQTSSFNELLSSLEDWAPFSPDPETSLFVGAIGFEDRSPACFERWCKIAEGKAREAILVKYAFNKVENERQEGRFLAAAKNAGVSIVPLDYNQRSIYGEMVAMLKLRANQSNVLIDLSSLASFAAFPILAAVFEIVSSASLDICYSEAADYFPKRAEWEAFQAKVKDLDLYQRARLFDEHHFQSAGVDVVFECAPFIGHNPDNLPVSLLVVPNFSFERTNRMIDYTSERYSVPRERCEWIIGVPPNREKNGWRHDALWQMFDQPSRKHEASTLHYKEMLQVLHQLWEERHSSSSLVIATTGSKAQHLATFLFLRMHPEVALVLSQPTEFIAAKFSEKTGDQWILHMGPISALAEKLIGWNGLRFIWD